MRFQSLHSFDLKPAEAVSLQHDLAGRVIRTTRRKNFRFLGGVDVSYEKHGDLFFAGIVVYDLKGGEIVERAGASLKSPFPYIPGLLSFREGPAILRAAEALRQAPDVLLFDGHGLAHPRRFGIACHLGLFLDLPSIGCGKTPLVGKFVPPETERGEFTHLSHKEETIGAVVRTRTNVSPIFVSIGHKMDLDTAISVVLAAGKGYRLPEPTRLAHLFVNELRRGEGGGG